VSLQGGDCPQCVKDEERCVICDKDGIGGVKECKKCMNCFRKITDCPNCLKNDKIKT
jgi:hypothetical protein